LYKETEAKEHREDTDALPYVRVEVGEVNEALKHMKNLKTGADDGLVAEMLKTGHGGLLEVLALFFSDILNGLLEPPETWKVTKLKLIFKKGDPEFPKNYRPISIIPVMAKLFSTVLYLRIQAKVESRLAEEQFGFGKDGEVRMRCIPLEQSLKNRRNGASLFSWQPLTSRRPSTASTTRTSLALFSDAGSVCGWFLL
jgi:hypothetical protein